MAKGLGRGRGEKIAEEGNVIREKVSYGKVKRNSSQDGILEWNKSEDRIKEKEGRG